ncbi:fungal-specific transcription factor domain-containing protein [Tirmania nivea]|nr:fungal-specific transcription factor domain-containing protein [Tirmania nivea]
MSNPSIPATPDQRHVQQQQPQQQHQQQRRQPIQTAEVAGEPSGYFGAGSSSAANTTDVLPNVVVPAVTELVSGRVSPRSMLKVLPEQKRPKGVITRRAFQPRRRSRACDQCRTRKTKCDTPNDGPCSSCVAASLECHFSEGGDERRRAGPTRRLRAYEALTRELQEKLDRANALLQSVGYAPIQSSASIALTTPPSPSAASVQERSGAYSGDSASTYMGSSPIASMPQPNILRVNNEQQDLNTISTGPLGGFMSTNAPHLDNSANRRRAIDEPSAWDNGFYGSSSCPSFATSYKEYLERLGFTPPPLGRRLSIPENGVPDLPTRWPINKGNEVEVDLRSLLPEKAEADEWIEVYRKTLQKYLPAFHWPMLEQKWTRAWEEPIWERDKEAVRSVFCIVILLLAVSCQMIEGWQGNAAGMEERQGWVYFLMAKHFHDEYPPVYTIDDAAIFLLMSIYLMNASLPSPCWMMIGATCRVFQDLGLHKMPQLNQVTKVEQECRNRLFWAAYVLDRQIGIVFGRPVIFHDQDIDVKFPGLVDEEGVGPTGQETSEKATGHQAGGSQGLMDSAEMSLRVYRALIQVCRCFEKVRATYALEAGSEEDIMRLREVEHQLDRAWDMFPSELMDILSNQPLEIAALRPLLDAQHARLLLYRSFTDFSKPLQSTWRTFCLAQSVHTCKVTARLLVRCTYLPRWDTEFALKSNETVRIHAFRAAALLLLGYSINDPAIERVEKDEVLVCIRVLKASSKRHHSMMKPMQMIEGLARMFGCDTRDVQGQLERTICSGGEVTSSTDERDICNPPEPMEWANFSVGDGGNEKTKEQQAQSLSIQSRNPQFTQIPHQEQHDERERRQQQQQQPHPSLQTLQQFDTLRRPTSQPSDRQQQSPFSSTSRQNHVFPTSESSTFNRPQPRSAFRPTPGVLSPIITEAPSALSTGLPTTPSVVSSFGGLMLSPIQRAQSSAPAFNRILFTHITR